MGAEQNTSNNEKENPKVMDFMKQWLRLNGISQAAAAKFSGYSQNTISHWMKVDDAKLSSMEKLFEALGYKISFSIDEPISDDTQIIRVPTEQNGTQVWMKSEPMPDSEKFPVPGVALKRLYYIRIYLIRRGVTYKELARNMGLAPQSVQYWFKADDIFISYIYKIAEALKTGVYISFNRIKK